MAAFIAWLDQNWFSFLQSAGIIGSLCFTAAALRREKRSHDISERLSLLGQHRELWSEMYQRPDLSRVKDPNSDLVAKPISLAEREFLNLVIVHFENGWQLAKAGSVNSLQTMRTDVRTFFSLPIPRAVWEETGVSRDEAFRRFVEGCFSR